jgi:hypothetical protein
LAADGTLEAVSTGMTNRRAKVWVALARVGGALAPPLGYWALDAYGPANRVEFVPYLPRVDILTALVLAALLAASLCASELRRRLAQGAPPRERRRPWIKLMLLGLLLAWLVRPQFGAFPAGAGIAERDAWARSNVREYPGLARVVTGLPEVTRDIGRVVALAPTAHDKHQYWREMNGDDLRFTLEVVGEHGSGTFHADCTLDGNRVLEWRAGAWTYGGKTRAVVVPLTR